MVTNSSEIYGKEFYDETARRAKNAAEICAQVLKKFVNVKSVIDVGAGTGVWTRVFLEQFPDIRLAQVVDLDKRNFLPFNNIGSDTRLILSSCNFETDAFVSEDIFDLGICTEVLEHIDMRAANFVLSQLAKSCRLLIFSAAVPGQGGTHHINEQTLAYWSNLLKSFGFSPLDVLRHELKGESNSVPDYYANNCLLWVNRKLDGLTLIDFHTLIDQQMMPVWDVRPSLLRLRHHFFSFFPISILTFISQLRNIAIRLLKS